MCFFFHLVSFAVGSVVFVSVASASLIARYAWVLSSVSWVVFSVCLCEDCLFGLVFVVSSGYVFFLRACFCSMSLGGCSCAFLGLLTVVPSFLLWSGVGFLFLTFFDFIFSFGGELAFFYPLV